MGPGPMGPGPMGPGRMGPGPMEPGVRAGGWATDLSWVLVRNDDIHIHHVMS